MLSLHYNPERYQRTDNFIPTNRGFRSRPSLRQLLDGTVTSAHGWGNRFLLERGARIAVWDGDLHDIAPGGTTLSATAFEALTTNAQRENRIYIADGVNPLWYVAYRADTYVTDGIHNTIKQDSGVPYPLEPAILVENWQERLFFTSNDYMIRARHCAFDDPDTWDPLWTLEFQSPQQDSIRAICNAGDLLIVGLGSQIRAVSGTSEYNFARPVLDANQGVSGPRAIASNSQSEYAWIGTGGAYLQGSLVSADIENIFFKLPIDSDVQFDRDRKLLLCLVAGRLFVMSLDSPGRWGEIMHGTHINGLVNNDLYTGFYADDGLWVLDRDDAQDIFLDGSTSDVLTTVHSWPVFPNLSGSQRAVNTRTRLTALNANASLTYTATSDEATDTATASLVSSSNKPQRLEFVPRIPGTRFEHFMQATGYLEVHDFAPDYDFGAEAA